MKIWEAPELIVLALPTAVDYNRKWTDGLEPAELSLAWKYPPFDGERIAETAGRSCYWSFGKGRKTNAEYLANILESGHGSVLEHANWTFGLRGISRSLSHELVRHRHLSFSQLSQRFVTEEPEFVRPPGLPDHAKTDWEDACARASLAYKSLLQQVPDTKAGREVARSVLPNAAATRIVVTGNARALRHMLGLRGSLHADAEFRRLSVLWTEQMQRIAPNIFQDFSIQIDDERGPYVLSEYHT